MFASSLTKKFATSAVITLGLFLLSGNFNTAAAARRTQPAAGCVVSSGRWANAPLASTQNGSFQVSFDATPATAGIDGVVGVSSGAASDFTQLAAIVRFNSTGTIDARNAENYVAATSIPYSAGVSYHFILNVNVAAHTYSASVMIGSVQTVIGSNLAFRTEQAAVKSLNEIGGMASPGTETFCNIALGAQTTAPSTAPVVTTQPASQTLTAGQAATFTVAASGTGPMTYQWQKNRTNIAGATSNTYTIPATTTANSGSGFNAIVSNTAGTATSTTAMLTVKPAVTAPVTPTPVPPAPVATAPAVTSQPASQTLTAGQTATFTVAASGTGPLTYQWQKNNANIAGANSSSYTTPATTTANTGSTFDVIVTNAAGTVTSASAMLTVNAASTAPVVSTQPASQTVASSKSATFFVVASGTGTLTYQWQKNKANIVGATSASYTTPATTSTDNGSTFDVVVTNSVGSATSSSASLTVTTSTLTVSASPTALSFGSVNLSSTSTKSVTLTNTGNATVTISNVMISGAGFDGSGGSGITLTAGQTATISATFAPSSAGSATGSLTVVSNATNSPTTIALSGTAVAPVTHSASLSWQASNSAVIGYNVYSTTSPNGTFSKLTGSPTTAMSYVDMTVQAGQTYYYVVTSVDTDNVESAYSNEVSALVP